MTENDVHKCLISYSFYPITKVLQDLEKDGKFEECAFILKAMESYKEKYSNLFPNNTPTQWSEEFEKEYLSYYTGEFIDLAKNNVSYYVSDIKNRLRLK